MLKFAHTRIANAQTGLGDAETFSRIGLFLRKTPSYPFEYREYVIHFYIKVPFTLTRSVSYIDLSDLATEKFTVFQPLRVTMLPC